ncbi:ABC transporter permease [Ochrobactrum vermis]|uniref:ABC transporter permease n=1 Tax=Ochrobactrum vermis TaxID=1827297 RepID=A0ABU8PMF0_9HYPH|nr:ABC transporter permease [Ochrobactrum vermis]PQZ26861.1 ABC transporter permease [Ochrobactrum vermis]
MNFQSAPLSAWIGLVGLVTILLCALLAPWIAPYDSNAIVGEVWAPSGAEFLLGTDNLGRDLLSRLLFGARATVFVALAASIIAFSLGVTLSFIAVTVGGTTDQLMSRINDLFMSIPALILALIVLAALPSGTWTLIAVMGLIEATRVYRIGRSVALDISVMDYIEGARLRGESTLWIVFREILPNVAAPLLGEFGLRFAFSVLYLSALSFLGLGIQPPVADWGGMVKDNKDGIVFGISAALVPGAAIALLAICVNLVVDWLINKSASTRRSR